MIWGPLLDCICGRNLKEMINGGKDVPWNRGSECADLEAKVCLTSSSRSKQVNVAQATVKEGVLGDEVQEDKGSDHKGLVSHCNESEFCSEWGIQGPLECRVMRINSCHEMSKGKSRDGLEYCLDGLDKSSGRKKWSQSGYILKVETTGFANR